MNLRPILLVFLFLLNSCLVVKIYESPESTSQHSNKPHQMHREMIGSGKTIELGEGRHQEILFFGVENSPKGFLFEEKNIEIGEQRIDTTLTWSQTGKNEKIKISITDQAQPLFVVDGKVLENATPIKALAQETIASINIIKGDAAIKKYGEKGLNGVVEITTK